MTRTLLSGNISVGSDAPAVYTYLGATGELTTADIESTNIKPGDTIMVTETIGALPIICAVDATFTLVVPAP